MVSYCGLYYKNFMPVIKSILQYARVFVSQSMCKLKLARQNLGRVLYSDVIVLVYATQLQKQPILKLKPQPKERLGCLPSLAP